MSRRATTALMSCALALCGAASTVTRAQTPLTYGMNLRVLDVAQADKMVELGARTARVVFGWDVLEQSCKGCFNFAQTDAYLAQARRTRLSIFGTLAYSPGWANGGHAYNYPPLDYRDWYDFVFATVSRYSRDVKVWGIWNEPNLDVFFHDGDLRAYQMIAVTAHAAIRAADPSAVIVGPEVSHHAFPNGWYAAAMRDFGDQFDIVTLHWYPDGPDLELMMDRMVRPFAGGRPVWLTEAGMKPCVSVFGEAGQAALYSRVLQALASRRSWWTGLFFYDLYDPPEPMDCGSGITRAPDYSNRPAFLLYRDFIRAHP